MSVTHSPPAANVRVPNRVAWLAVAVPLLLLGLPTLLYPFGRDQAMFAYVGQVWREGGLPYRDAWDVKLPAIYAAYSLFGRHEWGPRLVDLFAAAGMAAALIALEKRRAGGNTGVGVLAAVIGLVFTLGALDFWNLAQAETLIAPLSAAAMVMAFSRRWFLAGLLAGCAATFKTTAVLGLLPIFLAAVMLDQTPTAADNAPPSRRRAVLWVIAGAACPVAFWMVYFAAHGALPYLWELVATQAEYAGGDPRLAGSTPLQRLQALRLSVYLPLVGLSLCGAVASWPGTSRRAWRSAESLILVWWLAALAQVLVQRRLYLYHWSVLTPPAAWLAATFLLRLWHSASGAAAGRHWRRALVTTLCALAAVLALAPRWPGWALALEVARGRRTVAEFRATHYGVFDYDPGAARQVADHVRARSKPQDELLVFGFEPELYVYSGRRARTRHASDAPITGETSIRETRRRAWFEELLSDVQRDPPLYIVDREPPRPRPEWCRPFHDLLAAQYRHEATIGTFKIYRRHPHFTAVAQWPPLAR